MIEELLPSGVACSESFEDPPGTPLFPAEEAALGRAVQKRRNEFTTVRRCARRSLAELGLPPSPVLPGLHGAPQWPEAVVGSMTHCAGYRGAALAHRAAYVAIGIDAEPNDVLPEGVLEAIALPSELAWIDEFDRVDPSVCWGRLLFSAKESVYKTWYPLTGQRLEFEDARLTVDPARRTFVASLLPAAPSTGEGAGRAELNGRWLIRHGLVVTAIALVPSAAS
jgi:4'-phosphopantetheinyl transferase EntD